MAWHRWHLWPPSDLERELLPGGVAAGWQWGGSRVTVGRWEDSETAAKLWQEQEARESLALLMAQQMCKIPATLPPCCSERYLCFLTSPFSTVEKGQKWNWDCTGAEQTAQTVMRTQRPRLILWKSPLTPFTPKAVFYSKAHLCFTGEDSAGVFVLQSKEHGQQTPTKPHSLPPPWKCTGRDEEHFQRQQRHGFAVRSRCFRLMKYKKGDVSHLASPSLALQEWLWSHEHPRSTAPAQSPAESPA